MIKRKKKKGGDEVCGRREGEKRENDFFSSL